MAILDVLPPVSLKIEDAKDTLVAVQILVTALDNVLDKWKQARDYEWCSDQFKAIRQDLTLQVAAIDSQIS